jgi:hypothetical protein
MWPDEEDALSWQEREFDAADREKQEEDQARHEPLPQPKEDSECSPGSPQPR